MTLFPLGNILIATRCSFYKLVKSNIQLNKHLSTNSVDTPALLVLSLVREVPHETGCLRMGGRRTSERKVHLSGRAAVRRGAADAGPQGREDLARLKCNKEARGAGWGGRRVQGGGQGCTGSHPGTRASSSGHWEAIGGVKPAGTVFHFKRSVRLLCGEQIVRGVRGKAKIWGNFR